MTKEQVKQIIKNIDVSRYPLREHRLTLNVIDDGVRGSLRSTDEGDDIPHGLHSGYGFIDVAVPFETARKEDIINAAEQALVGMLTHELHEHMRYEGKIVFDPHPEVPGYLEKLNQTPLD